MSFSQNETSRTQVNPIEPTTIEQRELSSDGAKDSIGQEKVNSSIPLLDTVSIQLNSKAELKEVIEKLFNIYGNDLSKIKRNEGTTILNSNYTYKETVNDTTFTMVEQHQIHAGNNSIIKLQVELLGKNQELFANPYSDKMKMINAQFTKIKEFYEDKKWTSSVEFTFKDTQPGCFARDNDKKQRKYITRIFNKTWRYSNKPNRLIIGYNHQLNYSSFLLAPNDFNPATSETLETRRKNEHGSLKSLHTTKIGFSRYQHGFYGSFSMGTYAINFQDSASLNYETGLYENNEESTNLEFNMRGIGLHYRYSNYINPFSVYCSAGFTVNWLNKAAPFEFIGVATTGALGLNFKPYHFIEIHIAPTATYFLTPFDGENISSRIVSLGFEAGFTFNIALPE